MKIYLNAGHDRLLDSGAVNEAMGLRECDLAYELAQNVKGYLERNGVAVLFGQQDNLYAVCGEANDAEADAFVSLHFNAFNKRAAGTETLISHTAESLLLGHAIQSNIKAVLNLPDRGLKERSGLFVLRNTVMPAVVVEVCFIDNDYDIRQYQSRADAVARAIATGIMQWPAMARKAAA